MSQSSNKSHEDVSLKTPPQPTVAKSLPKIGKSQLALLDQCFVSGCGFATILILGRCAGTAELGLYSIGFSLLLVAMAVQGSLIVSPFTIFSPRMSEAERRLFSGSVLFHALVLAALFAIVFCVFGQLLASLGSVYANVILVLALSSPGILLKDFARRSTFVRLAFGEAIFLDATAAILRIAMLVGLHLYGSLHAVSALVAYGATDSLVVAGWLYLRRNQFQLDLRSAGSDLASNFDFGRWLLASQLVFTTQCNSVQWAVAGALGPKATGVYSACNSIVQLSSPMIQAAGNYLGPFSSNAYASGGSTELFSVAWKTTLAMAKILLVYGLVVGLGARLLLELFFGESMASESRLVIVLAIGLVFTGVGLPAAKAISVLGRPELNFYVNFLSMLVTVVAAGIGAWSGSLFWAATGASVGLCLAFVFRFSAYLTLDRAQREPR